MLLFPTKTRHFVFLSSSDTVSSSLSHTQTPVSELKLKCAEVNYTQTNQDSVRSDLKPAVMPALVPLLLCLSHHQRNVINGKFADQRPLFILLLNALTF